MWLQYAYNYNMGNIPYGLINKFTCIQETKNLISVTDRAITKENTNKITKGPKSVSCDSDRFLLTTKVNF